MVCHVQENADRGEHDRRFVFDDVPYLPVDWFTKADGYRDDREDTGTLLLDLALSSSMDGSTV